MYGAEFSSILPNQQRNPLNFYLDLRQQQQAQERYQQQLQQQQDHYNDKLLSDLANRLDFKDFATGTVFDPVFQHNLDAGLKSVAQTLKGGGSYADALMQAMRTAGEVGNYSGLIKKKRAEIEAAAKLYDKDPSIDSDALKRHALTRYLFNPDHSMKDTSQLADDSDYVTSLLENNPELVTKGLGSLYDQIEKGKYVPYKGEVTRDVGGVKRLTAYEGKYDPLYNELVNAKGEVVTDNTATGVRVKSVPVKIGEQSLSGVSEDVLNHFYQTPGTKAAVKAEARKMLRFLPEGTKQVDAEKIVLHRELANSANSYINKTKDDYDNSQLVGMENARALRELAASNRAQKEGEGLSINDVYSDIEYQVDGALRDGFKGKAMNTLPAEAQKLVLEEARKLTGLNGLGNKHIYLKKDPITRRIGIYADDVKDEKGNVVIQKDQWIGDLTAKGVNVRAQPDVKRKGQVIEQASSKPKFVGVPKGGKF